MKVRHFAKLINDDVAHINPICFEQSSLYFKIRFGSRTLVQTSSTIVTGASLIEEPSSPSQFIIYFRQQLEPRSSQT